MVRFSQCRCSCTLVIAALILASVPARALEPRELAGWWIALDETFPLLSEAGVALPMEELLIVKPDGTAENRVMNFTELSTVTCSKQGGRFCSDAPLIAHARLDVTDKLLTFTDMVPGPGPLDGPEPDQYIRALAITSAPSWTATIAAGTTYLLLQSTAPALTVQRVQDDIRLLQRTEPGAITRTFVKVDPNDLRPVRAGMMRSELSVINHWRCYLGNAMARNPTFAAVLPAKNAAPSGLSSYLRVASYLAALRAQFMAPTPDHPDPEVRESFGVALEQLIMPMFEDLVAPVLVIDIRRAAAKVVYLEERAKGASRENAQAAAAAISGEAVQVPLSEDEISAYERFHPNSATFSSLFCSEN